MAEACSPRDNADGAFTADWKQVGMHFGEGRFAYLSVFSGDDGVNVYREQVGFCIGNAGWIFLKKKGVGQC